MKHQILNYEFSLREEDRRSFCIFNSEKRDGRGCALVALFSLRSDGSAHWSAHSLERKKRTKLWNSDSPGKMMPTHCQGLPKPCERNPGLQSF